MGTNTTAGAQATAPAKMTAPVLTASPNAISVDRANSSADGGSAITRYDLRYGTDGVNYTVAEQTTDPQSITGLANGTAYRVSTRAVNAVGPGAWSDDATATPVAAADPAIAVTQGRGVAGSTYTVTNGGTGSWQEDQEDIAGATASTYVLSLANEGRAIRWLRSDGAASNVIQLWVPQRDLPGVVLVMDVRQRRTPVAGGTSSWQSLAGSNRTGTQATTANQPVYSPDALGTGIAGLIFDGTDFLEGIAAGASSTSRCVLALANFENQSDNRTVLGGTANGDFAFRRDGNGRMQIVLSGIASLATDSAVVPNGATVMVGVAITQNSVAEFRQNGRATTTVTPAGNAFPTSSTQQVGRALAAQMMLGRLGPIIEADSFPTIEDRQRMEGWMSAVSGGPIDGAHPFASAAPRLR